MEWGLKVVVIAVLLIVFFLVVIGLLMVWTGQSNDIASGIFDFLKNLGSYEPGGGTTTGTGGGTPSSGGAGGGTSGVTPTTPPPSRQLNLPLSPITTTRIA